MQTRDASQIAKPAGVTAAPITTRELSGTLFRRGQLRIRTRLTACFAAIILSIFVASLVAAWQFHQITSSGERLSQADQISLAALVVHLDIDTLRNRLTALADTHDGPEFATESGFLRQKFLEDVNRAGQLYTASSEVGHDPLILSTLQTLQVTLPSQVDQVMGLAAVNDWSAAHSRLTDQVQGLVDLSALLVERVDREVSQQRADAIESAQRARRQLFIVLPATVFIALLMAVLLGWHVTRTITEPLSELSMGAQALAHGDFQHEVAVTGEDELATLANGFNYAARHLRELYDGLRESEELWRATFESNPTMYFMVDEAGTIVSVNPFGAEQLGYGVSELVGQPALSVFYEPDREAVRRYTEGCFQQPGKTQWWEARRIRKDGTMIWVRETANAVWLKKQPVLLVVCENITEQKGAEEAARRSERELRDLVENVPAMVFVALPGASNEFASRRWREYTGLSVEDTAGHGWQSVVHAEDIERHIEKWRVSSASEEPFEDEARFRRSADGEYRWFLVRAAPLRDETGRAFKWYGVLTDIEDRKRAEQELRRSEAYLAEAQKLTHTGSFATDSRDVFYWSDENYRIWGFDPQHGPPTGEVGWQRIHPEDRDRVREHVKEALRAKAEWHDEFRIVLPDGNVKYIHAVNHPVFDASGQLMQTVGTHVDVTERKHAEQERDRLRQIEAELAHINRVTIMGELAASLAHEIKQPMAAAVSNAEASLQWLARDEPDLQEVREAATEAVKEVTRAAEIINRMRSLFQKEQPRREAVDINEVISEMLFLVRDEASSCSVLLRTELDPTPPKITADRVQLQQVLMNLMLNGIEAMRDTGGELTVKSQQDERGRVLISVSDTGVGLPTENPAKIFDAFFTTKAQGTGMGLAISRSIIEAHGGRLWATANSGPGAIFYFSLPNEVAVSA